MNNEYINLKEGQQIPSIGLGTWQLEGDTCIKSVEKALEYGYRHIDTADAYGNHLEVGRAIKGTGINRDSLFITSKVWIKNLNRQGVFDTIKRSLEELDMDYINLMLIHWPSRSILMNETLESMQEAKEAGLIRSIGVSNFTIAHLKDVLKTGISIENNQVEFHPSLNQKELKEFCDQNSIVLTAYSPVAQGEDMKLGLVQDLAQKYSKSTSQIILNWLVSKKIIAIPRSSNPVHIKDNLESLSFFIEKEDLEKIDSLNTNNRILNPPFADFGYGG
jgi:2,5-diketo-D-gluconate reductase B